MVSAFCTLTAVELALLDGRRIDARRRRWRHVADLLTDLHLHQAAFVHARRDLQDHAGIAELDGVHECEVSLFGVDVSLIKPF